jgi:hypothetical protein
MLWGIQNQLRIFFCEVIWVNSSLSMMCTLYCATLYCATLYCATLYCATLYNPLLPCATLCYPLLPSATLYYPVQPCATLCYPVLCYPLLTCATLCYPVLPCATLCYTVLPCATLSCATLYYPVLPCAAGLVVFSMPIPETRNTRPPVSLLLCDNLKNRMFLQNLFFLTLFREFVTFFQLSTSFHYSTAKQFH